jgi:hypothetical protein
VLPQFGFKQLEGQLGVPGIVAVNNLVVGDDNHHRDGLLFREQVVHDETRAPVVAPIGRQLAAAADEVKHGIGFRAVVARRCVNV